MAVQMTIYLLEGTTGKRDSLVFSQAATYSHEFMHTELPHDPDGEITNSAVLKFVASGPENSIVIHGDDGLPKWEYVFDIFAPALLPNCDKCGQPQAKPGALLFSPPDELGRVDKAHWCVGCYDEYQAREY